MSVHYTDEELETLCSSGCHSTSYNHDTGGIPYLTCEFCGEENKELRPVVVPRRDAEFWLKVAVTVMTVLYVIYVGLGIYKTRQSCVSGVVTCELYMPRQPSRLEYVERINDKGYPEWRWETR